MDAAQVIDWSREALRMALLLGGPPLLVALLVGVVVGMGQTLTQMHEPVIGLVPRLLAVLLVVLAVLPWLVSRLGRLRLRGDRVDSGSALIGSDRSHDGFQREFAPCPRPSTRVPG